MKSESQAKTLLERAIHAQRSEPRAEESLSDRARDAILADLTGAERRLGRLPGLFAPLPRLALAGAVPLLLTVLVVAWLSVRGPESGIAPQPGTLQVSKVGDRVVFTIPNGNRDHQVSRSTSPDGSDPAGAETVTRGSFADRLDSGPDLVFYRVD